MVRLVGNHLVKIGIGYHGKAVFALDYHPSKPPPFIRSIRGGIELLHHVSSLYGT